MRTMSEVIEQTAPRPRKSVLDILFGPPLADADDSEKIGPAAAPDRLRRHHRPTHTSLRRGGVYGIHVVPDRHILSCPVCLGMCRADMVARDMTTRDCQHIRLSAHFLVLLGRKPSRVIRSEANRCAHQRGA